jgi:hypothetical protein
MNTFPSFRPYQVLCIEHKGQFFYSEMIQKVTLRQSYWVRPLALKIDENLFSKDFDVQKDSIVLYDLRGQSDLILPSTLFRAALDTEVVQLLVSVDRPGCYTESDRSPHCLLHDLVTELCQSYPGAFGDADPTGNRIE